MQNAVSMRARLAVAAVLVGQSACAAVVVDVSNRHPTPRLLASRPVETLKTYEVRPTGGVAVYGLQASGEELAEVDAAVRHKAASLGCDGIMVAVREDQKKSVGQALTGQLNEHHEYVTAHIDALCVVEPIAPDCSGGATAPEIDVAARGMLEQWRQAQEQGGAEALAGLYVHDASLTVIDDGAPLLGWAAVERALRGREGAQRIRLDEVQVRAVAGTAIVLATVERQRAGETERGALTLVLQGPPATWRIIAEHTSFRRS